MYCISAVKIVKYVIYFCYSGGHPSAEKFSARRIYRQILLYHIRQKIDICWNLFIAKKL